MVFVHKQNSSAQDWLHLSNLLTLAMAAEMAIHQDDYEVLEQVLWFIIYFHSDSGPGCTEDV